MKRLLVLLVALACEGPIGPAGPAGPMGPQGDPGPGTRLTFAGQTDDDGNATVALPEEAGTLSNPPAVTCYIGPLDYARFEIVGGPNAPTGTACRLFQPEGRPLYVELSNAPSRWFYKIVVVW